MPVVRNLQEKIGAVGGVVGVSGVGGASPWMKEVHDAYISGS